MRTRVPTQYRPQTVARDDACSLWARAQQTKVVAHLTAIAGNEIVPAGLEKIFAVVPRGRHERNSTSERFEHADGGDARKTANIEAPGNVHGERGAREH